MFVCYVMFVVNDSEVVDCVHEHIFLLSLHFGGPKCLSCRKRSTVLKLASIITYTHFYNSCVITLLISVQVQQAGTGPQLYKGPLDVVKQLYKTGGIRSIYKGTCATLLRGV